MEKLFLFSIVLYALLSVSFYKRLRGKAYIAPLIPLLVGAGQAGYQFFQAAKQRREAEKAKNYLPPGLVQAENIARVEAGATRYPGQTRDESNIRQNTADTFQNVSRATTSSGDLLNAASKLNNAQGRALEGVARNADIFKQNALDRYRSTLAQKAGYQMQARMYSEQLKGAAARNEYNGVTSLGGGAIQAGLAGDWNKMFGGANPVTMGYNPMSGAGSPSMMNPNMFSTYGFNPLAFSAGGNFFKP